MQALMTDLGLLEYPDCSITVTWSFSLGGQTTSVNYSIIT